MEIRAKSEQARLVLQAASDGDCQYLDSVSDHALRTAICTSGCTALHWAAGSNQVTVLEYLIQQRRTVFQVDVPATKKSRGRTPLHYSCRNGCFEAAQWLVRQAGASVDPRAKHGVTPFQLAVWQNQWKICQWLVEEEGVDPCQVNDFDCGAVHWLGTCPVARANITKSYVHSDEDCKLSIGDDDDNSKAKDDGSDLLPLAQWLAKQPGIDFTLRQRQGHTPLHKAAWGGHSALIRYLRNEHGLWDDCQDEAGNFAADLADMAHTPRHAKIARYLRQECSRARSRSCTILGVDSATTNRAEIRKAYLEQAKKLHPDRRQLRQQRQQGREETTSSLSTEGDDTDSNDEFDALHNAYVHLMEEDGHGNQSNPAHSLHLMLQVSGLQSSQRDNSNFNNEQEALTDSNLFFKARLIAVLLEYGDSGLDLSNVKKKWKQVWPNQEFPSYDYKATKKNSVSLSQFLREEAGDVIKLVTDGKGVTRVYAKDCSQSMVAVEAAKIASEEAFVAPSIDNFLEAM